MEVDFQFWWVDSRASLKLRWTSSPEAPTTWQHFSRPSLHHHCFPAARKVTGKWRFFLFFNVKMGQMETKMGRWAKEQNFLHNWLFWAFLRLWFFTTGSTPICAQQELGIPWGCHPEAFSQQVQFYLASELFLPGSLRNTLVEGVKCWCFFFFAKFKRNICCIFNWKTLKNSKYNQFFKGESNSLKFTNGFASFLLPALFLLFVFDSFICCSVAAIDNKKGQGVQRTKLKMRRPGWFWISKARKCFFGSSQ